MNTMPPPAPPMYDEMFDAAGTVRPACRPVWEHLAALPPSIRQREQAAAEHMLRELGATFSVYGDAAGTEKVLPFDIVPRVLSASEWRLIERGLKQRIRALNLFIDDVYHDQRILRDGIVPADLVRSASHYRPECMGLDPPGDVWCHITGSDLVRDRDGTFYVLEDNLRCPSGVSYVLNNRRILKQAFPRLLKQLSVQPVEDYPGRLLDVLHAVAPPGVDNPRAAILTPGIHNSAYFEHAFLARQTGMALVEGRDLVVHDEHLYVRTTRGFQRIDVLYRRVDDDYLDPQVFREDSTLGVPGLFQASRSGNVTLVNAPGTGVADDKVIYTFVPAMIRYYLGEDPVLPNVPTYLCGNDKDRQHVLANLDTLVVKAANESGGYGMLVGPHASAAQRAEFAQRIQASPRNYIAQPTLALSTAPVLDGEGFAARHVDLRPYVLFGKDIHVMPGGLTRVALREGSLVVNSSQGGGSKDTWVLTDGEDAPC